MLQYIIFSIVYGIMMFIWSFVYLNKSKDKINQAFLVFLSVIIVWMILSISNGSDDISTFGLIIKTLYFYSMLNMSIAFLLFVYQFIKRKLDRLFYIAVTINTLTILSRYLFPIDYSDPTFWRLNTPVVAPVMSLIFSLPAIFALFLLIQHYRLTKDCKLKAQLRNLFIGTGLACLISIISEYILPTWFGLDTHLFLMYFAILIFVMYIFVSIIKCKFLNIQSDYIYRKLFLNSNDGIIIVNRNSKIISINNLAREILQNEDIESGDKITNFIKEYDFEVNYKQYEVTIVADGREKYLSITQHTIDPEDQDSEKLLMINDITAATLKLKQEKEMLMERTSIDQHTGLFNKQYFIDNYCMEETELTDRKLVLLFMDIDDFKSINDFHGHLVGDSILKSVAECIKDELSSNAKGIRFGGDEFVVIFENAEINEVYGAAERIRNRVYALDFSKHYGNLKISLSIGLVEGAAPVKELIVKADKAMYNSKSSGKNKTTIFSDCYNESSILTASLKYYLKQEHMFGDSIDNSKIADT
ncbi:diguanylate cyclase [Desulfitobacterium sp. PCE1]|uniref:diguanylate cyclase n=1 Tax=Desulfitobacterium sp. PCE1 TaxID=146907 RepID=UPI00036DE926|nr:diguanylate cyclase [Desulfitobacterium sp. PCE1]